MVNSQAMPRMNSASDASKSASRQAVGKEGLRSPVENFRHKAVTGVHALARTCSLQASTVTQEDCGVFDDDAEYRLAKYCSVEKPV